jgi:hypothetical protein
MDLPPGGDVDTQADRDQQHIALVLGALATAFFLVRVLGGPWPHFPATYPDSFSYLKVAARGPFHFKFYFDERPIGYPLLQWSMGRSTTLIVVAQTLIYVTAFWVLCMVLVKELSSRTVAFIAVVLIGAVAIEPRNSLWNDVILSESFSSSLAILSIAAWFRAAARPSLRTLKWAWIGTVAWILVRDTNVLPTLLVILPGALGLLFFIPRRERQIRRRLIVGAVSVVLVCGYVYVSQAHSHRTQYSVDDVVGMRVLPHPSITKWFVQGGMPLDDALRARTGHNAWDDNSAFLDAPNLAKYRTWARGPGGRRLLLSMVFLAPDWWKDFHHELPNILKQPNTEYDSYGVAKRLPTHWPAPLGEPRTTAAFWFELWLAAAGLTIAAFERRRRLIVYMLAIGMLSAIVDVWTSYTGDPMEVNRHLVGPMLRLDVLALMAIAIGADSAFTQFRSWRKTRNAPTPEPATDETETAEAPTTGDTKDSTVDA